MLIGIDDNPPYGINYLVPQIDADKSVSLDIFAIDGAGNVTSDSQTVLVRNDLTSPSTPVFLQPQAGHSLVESSQTLVNISAFDELGVQKVLFYVNNILVGEDVLFPYEFIYTAPDVIGSQSVEFASRSLDYTGHLSDLATLTLNIVDDSPPTVSIDLPQENVVLIENTELTVNVTANDDTGIRNVDIELDGQRLVSLPGPPFTASINLTDVDSPESHQINVIVTDNNNQETQLQRFFQINPDVHPDIANLSPPGGTTHFRGLNIPISADISDDVSISKIELLVDDQILETIDFQQVTTNYHISNGYDVPISLGAGSLSITLNVYDNADQLTSANHNVTIDDAPVPIVIIQSVTPTIGAFIENTSVDVSVTANSNLDINRIELLMDNGSGNVIVGQDSDGGTSSTFNFNLPDIGGLLSQSITLTAVAYDNRGQNSTSSGENIIVTPDQPPTGSLTVIPSVSGNFIEGSRVDIHVEAQDDVAVNQVDFLIDGQISVSQQGAVNNLFVTQYVLPAIPEGSNDQIVEFSAIITDTATNSANVVPVQITVTKDAVPSVSIIEPENNAEIVGGSLTHFVVDATDDTNVESVFIKVNGESLGELVAFDANRYEGDFVVPTASLTDQITIDATAVDAKNQTGQALPLNLNISFLANEIAIIPTESSAALQPHGGELLISEQAGNRVIDLANNNPISTNGHEVNISYPSNASIIELTLNPVSTMSFRFDISEAFGIDDDYLISEIEFLDVSNNSVSPQLLQASSQDLDNPVTEINDGLPASLFDSNCSLPTENCSLLTDANGFSPLNSGASFIIGVFSQAVNLNKIRIHQFSPNYTQSLKQFSISVSDGQSFIPVTFTDAGILDNHGNQKLVWGDTVNIENSVTNPSSKLVQVNNIWFRATGNRLDLFSRNSASHEFLPNGSPSTSVPKISEISLTGNIIDFVIINEFIIAITTSGEMNVIDIYFPEAPEMESTISIANANALSVSRNILAIADGSGVLLYDVSINSQTKSLNLVLQNTILESGTVSATIIGNNLWIATDSKLVNYDITNINSPIYLAGNDIALSINKAISVGQWIFARSSLNDSVSVIDSNTIDILGTIVTGSPINELAVRGDRLFLGHDDRVSIRKLDFGLSLTLSAPTISIQGTAIEGDYLAYDVTGQVDELTTIEIIANDQVLQSFSSGVNSGRVRLSPNSANAIVSLNAQALGLDGTIVESIVVQTSIVDDNSLPEISILAPQPNSSHQEGTDLAIDISAVDDVRLSSLEIMVDGNSVKSFSVPVPGQINETVFIPVDDSSAVNFPVRVDAIDVNGNTSFQEVLVSRINDDEAPVISIISPPAASVFVEGSPITVTVQITDTIDVASTVILIDDVPLSNLIETGISNGVELQGNFNAQEVAVDGTISIKVQAEDSAGNSSQVVRDVTVLNDDLPTITIIPPNGGNSLESGQVVPIEFNAQDDIGIQNVKLFIDGNVFGEDQNAPFTFNFTAPNVTTQTALIFTAEVFDTKNQAATSDPVAVTINIDEPPASVVFTGTSVGNTAREGTLFEINVDAVDTGGIDFVEFYLDGSELGQDSDSADGVQFSLVTTLPSISTGSESVNITARAFDRVGNNKLSDPFAFTITEDLVPTISFSPGITGNELNGEFYELQTIQLTADISDDVAIVEVDFLKEESGVPIQTLSNPVDGLYPVSVYLDELPDGVVAQNVTIIGNIQDTFQQAAQDTFQITVREDNAPGITIQGTVESQLYENRPFTLLAQIIDDVDPTINTIDIFFDNQPVTVNNISNDQNNYSIELLASNVSDELSSSDVTVKIEATDSRSRVGTSTTTLTFLNNTVPTAPVFTAPTSGQSFGLQTFINWTASTDNEQIEAELLYELDYQIQNTSDWVSIVSKVDGITASGGVGSHSFDTSTLANDTSLALRVRAFDGEKYSNYTDLGGFIVVNHFALGISLIDPADGTNVKEGDSLPLKAQIIASDLNVTKVEFFIDDQLVDTQTVPVNGDYVSSYLVPTLPDDNPNTASVKAVATNSRNFSSDSLAHNVTINPNAVPLAPVITAPTGGDNLNDSVDVTWNKSVDADSQENELVYESDYTTDELISSQFGTDGLLGYYSFDANVDDISGSNRDGTPLISTLFSSGVVDGALDLSAGDNYIDLPGIGLNDENDDFTISLWVNVSDTIGSKYIIANGTGAASDGLRWHSLFIMEGNKIRVVAGKAQVAALSFHSTTSFSANTWYHLLWTYDGIDTFTLFVDNTVDSVQIFDFPGGSIDTDDWVIGATSGSQKGGQLFRGLIDDVRIYDRVLPVNDINTLYQLSQPIFGNLWLPLIDISNNISTSGGTGEFPWNLSQILPTPNANLRMRAFDGINYSDWSESGIVSIDYQPTVSNGSVDSQSIQNYAFPQPEFAWTFTEIEEGSGQSAFQIQINTTNDFAGAVFLDTDKTPSLASSSAFTSFGASPLARGATYFWRVRVWDSADRESEWAGTSSFVVNTLPEIVFGSISQSNIADGVITILVTITDDDAIDPTIVTTDFSIDNETTWTPTTVINNVNSLVWNSTGAGIQYEDVKWRFVLTDGVENTDFFITPSFTVDNNLPSTPVLTSPVASDLIRGVHDITWNAANDPNQTESEIFFEIEYAVEVSSPTTLGMVGYYPYDGNATDLSGNNNNGTENGTISYVEGVDGQSASFEGTNSFIDSGSSSTIDNIFSSGGSISFWTRINGVQNQRFLEKRNTSGGWLFAPDSLNNNQVAFATFNSLNATMGLWRGSSNLVIGTWYFISIVYNQDTLENDPIFFINGEIETVVKEFTPSNTVSDSSATLFVGDSYLHDRPFKGDLDELRLYSRALTNDEVQVLYRFNNLVNPPSMEWLSLVDRDDQLTSVSGSGSFLWPVGLFDSTDEAAVRIRAFDGTNYSDWVESGLFAINYFPIVSDGLVDGLASQSHALTQPQFSWTFTEIEESSSQSSFQIQIDTTSAFDSPALLDTTQTPSLMSSWSFTSLGAPPLTRGQTYHWRVRVWDSADRESEWTEPINFKINSLPEITYGQITQAIDGGIINIPIVKSDADDGDTISIQSIEYTVNDGLNWQAGTISETVDSLVWDTLADNIGSESAKVRVQLFDGFELSNFIETMSFSVDNNAPSEPVITHPSSGDIVGGNVNVIWDAATDSDQSESELTYELQYTRDGIPPFAADEFGNVALWLRAEDAGKHQVSVFGDTHVNSVDPAIGSGAAAFDGSLDYLAISPSDEWNFGTNDFTIECFVKLNSLPGNGLFYTIVNEFGTNTNKRGIWLNNNGSYRWNFGDALGVFEYRVSTITTGVWYHIAWVRSGDIHTFYENGVALGASVTNASAMTTIGGELRIGREGGTHDRYLPGFIDELRISNGTARYLSNFTPPTAPFSLDPDTVLLLHLDGESNSTTFSDSSEIDGRAVSAWLDQSVNATHFLQSTTTHQPTAISDSVNGHPALLFNGSTSNLISSAVVLPSNFQEYSIFIVGKYLSGGDRTMFSQEEGDSDNGLLIGQNRLDYHRNTAGNGVSLAIGDHKIWQIRVEAAGNCALYENSVLLHSVSNVSGGSPFADNARIGAREGSGEISAEFFHGELSEIVIYDTALSASGQQQVERYLSEKYGIPIPNPGNEDPVWISLFDINNNISTTNQQGTYPWDVSNFADALAVELRIRAFDGFNYSNWNTSDVFSIDNGPPTNPSISIEDGEFVLDGIANLTLSADDASEMLLSEDALFTSAVWIPYNTEHEFGLSAANDTKTIYVLFRDIFGSESQSVSDVSRRITLAGESILITSDTVISANDNSFDNKSVIADNVMLTIDSLKGAPHNFTDVVLINGAVLSHSPWTPFTSDELAIDVTGGVYIDVSSAIDLTGKGFENGYTFDATFAANGTTANASTGESGGSYGGLGGVSNGLQNSVYGDYLNPSEHGSGASIGGSSEPGGGLLRLNTSGLTLDGIITVNGASGGGYGGASGGGIFINGQTIIGNGMITGNGGDTVSGGAGGGGRVAIYYDDISGFDPAKITATGGVASMAGNDGTVFLGDKTTNLSSFITNARVEGLMNPIDIQTTTPIFSWQFNDMNSGDAQSAYEIDVNDAPDFTGTMLWQSGKVISAVSSATYAGSRLTTTTYYWRVRVWDSQDFISDWSVWPNTFKLDPTIQQYVINITSATNGTVSGADGAFNYNAQVALTATPQTGYYFVEWAGDAAGTDENTVVTMADDLNVEAIFTARHQIILSPDSVVVPEGGQSQVSVRLASAPFAIKDVAVTAAYDSGDSDLALAAGDNHVINFNSVNWNVDQNLVVSALEDDADATQGSAQFKLSSPSTGDAFLTATENDNEFLLTVIAGDNGSVGNAGSSVYADNTVVPVDAVPDNGYSFQKWTGDVIAIADEFSASTTITGTTDLSISAVFITELIVDASFNTGTPGWEVTHFSSIQTAIDSAPDRTIIIVNPGIYYEHITISDTILTIRSQDPLNSGIVDSTVIDGQYNDEIPLVSMNNVNIGEVVFTGLTLRNNRRELMHCKNIDARIEHNVFTGGIGHGAIYGLNSNLNISANTISENIGAVSGGLFLEFCDATVSNNTITNNVTDRVRVQINSSSDDAEEDISTGVVDLTSSDLELINDSTDQIVGMRFTNISVPAGATILNAYIQFTTDEVDTGATTLVISGQASADPLSFTDGSGDISSRTKTLSSVNWNPRVWSVVDESGIDQHTPNIAPIIEEIVNDPAWTNGNSLVIFIEGSGERTAYSFDGNPNNAPILVLEYDHVTSTTRIDLGANDAEEEISSGIVDVSSSDLELINDGADQIVGMRFPNVPVPKDAMIINAFIQFTVDEPDSGSTSLIITGELSANSQVFTESVSNISSRTRTPSGISWDPLPWISAGNSGPDQKTPNIGLVIEEISSLPDWTVGNALTLFIQGSGERTAISFEGDPDGTPVLTIEYGSTSANQLPSGTEFEGAGALFLHGSTVDVLDNIITGNTNHENGAGGVYVLDSTVDVIGNTINDNRGDYSGAIYFDLGYMNIDDNDFFRNHGLDCGAIYMDEGTIDVTNNQIIDNVANDYGTGLTLEDGTANVLNNDIIGNSGDDAGGIFLDDITSALISDNTISDNDGYYAGAMYVGNSSGVSVSDNQILDNTGQEYCGGIYFYLGDMDVDGNTILRNQGGAAGGIFMDEGTIDITDNQIRDNGGNNHGAGITVEDGIASVVNNNIMGNIGDDAGGISLDDMVNASIRLNDIIDNEGFYAGGIYDNNSNAQISNNLIVSNTASSDSFAAGAILFDDSNSALITHNTIADNTAFGSSQVSGGIYCFDGSTPVFSHCILWNNLQSTELNQITVGSGSVSVNYCDVQGDRSGLFGFVNWGSENINRDPLFADAAGGDYHLKSQHGRWDGSQYVLDPVSSPCLYHGDPAAVFDNEPAPNGSLANIGAYGNTAGASLAENFIPYTVSIASPPRVGRLPEIVFSTDFESGIAPEFSGITDLIAVGGYSSAGFNGSMLRNASLGNPATKTTLVLTGLPPHDTIDIIFLLAIIDSWNGTGGSGAPDYFNVDIDGVSIFKESFDNFVLSHQTYDSPSGSSLISRLGDNNFPDLGFDGLSSWGEAAYDMGRDPRFDAIPHSSDTVTIDWYASGDGWGGAGAEDESFALDNIEIITNNGPSSTVFGGQGIYGAGEPVHLQAGADHYQFNQWSGDAMSTDNTLDLIVDGNMSVTAEFTRLIPDIIVTSPEQSTISISGSSYPQRPIITQGDITDDITLTQSGVITDVSVAIHIKHSCRQDLDISLIHPDNTDDSVILLHQSGGICEADAVISYPDGVMPVESLSSLEGKTAAGPWRLHITDNVGRDANGVLISWNLIVSTSDNTIPVTEGGTADLEVKLDHPPVLPEAIVNAAFDSGDSDITVIQGNALTFTSANWDIFQTTTLSAAFDGDTDADSAAFRFSSVGSNDVLINAVERILEPVSLGTNLTDDDSFLWDIDRNGSILDGTDDAYDGGLILTVNDVDFPSFIAGTSEYQQREIGIGAQSIDGFQVRRKLFVPADDAFSRFLEIIENPTNSDKTAVVTLRSNLGSNENTAIINTSSGNTDFDITDDYIVTDDANDGSGDPTLVHVFSGLNGIIEPDSVFTNAPGDDDISYSFTLVVPAGERRIIMHFAAQTQNQAQAALRAGELHQLSGSVRDSLSFAEQNDIVNFVAFPDSDDDGLFDHIEVALDTDPNVADTDADGVNDGEDAAPLNSNASRSVDILPAEGGVTDPAGTQLIADNTQLVITATSSIGFEFSSWGGDISDSINPVTITVTGNLVVTPLFNQAAGYLLVDPAHDNTISGWDVTRFSSIQRAIEVALNGQIVLVNSGTYNEQIDFLGKTVTVTSTDPDNQAVIDATVIDGQAHVTDSTVTFNSGEGLSSILTGFTIRNGSPANILCDGSSPTIDNNVITAPGPSAVGQIDIKNSASPKIINNQIKGGKTAIVSTSSTPEISANLIFSNTNANAVLKFTSSNGVISGNNIYDNTVTDSGVVYLSASAPSISNNIIANNIITGTGGSIHCDNASPQIVNNTIVNNSSTGDQVTDINTGGILCSNAGSPVIVNCILWGNTRDAAANQIHIISGTPAVTFSAVEGGYTGAGNITLDPLFFDEVLKDFHLKSEHGRFDPLLQIFVNDAETSPGIDAGDTNSDFSNEPSPNGSRINMGAYGNTQEASKSQP